MRFWRSCRRPLIIQNSAAAIGISMTLIHQVGSICMAGILGAFLREWGTGATLGGHRLWGLEQGDDVAGALSRDLLPLRAAPADAGGRGRTARGAEGRPLPGTAPGHGPGAPARRGRPLRDHARRAGPARRRDSAEGGVEQTPPA